MLKPLEAKLVFKNHVYIKVNGLMKAWVQAESKLQKKRINLELLLIMSDDALRFSAHPMILLIKRAL